MHLYNSSRSQPHFRFNILIIYIKLYVFIKHIALKNWYLNIRIEAINWQNILGLIIFILLKNKCLINYFMNQFIKCCQLIFQ